MHPSHICAGLLRLQPQRSHSELTRQHSLRAWLLALELMEDEDDEVGHALDEDQRSFDIYIHASIYPKAVLSALRPAAAPVDVNERQPFQCVHRKGEQVLLRIRNA